MAMKERIDYIDSAKGILIFLVVLGHSINSENALKTVIYSFHMPAFFIISGLLMNYSSAVVKGFWPFLLSRIRQLIIPYLVFEFLGFIVQGCMWGFYENLNGFIFRVATFQVHTDVDWFLVGLFFAEIMFYFARKNKYFCIAAAVVSFITAYFIPIRFVKWILSGFLYLVIGYYGLPFLQKIRKELLLCSFISVLVASCLNVRVDINNGVFGNPILYLIGALGGMYLVIALSRQKLPVKNILNFCGRSSLIIMGTHTLIIQVLWHRIYTGQISDWAACVLMLFIVLICECLILLLYKKIKAISKEQIKS